MYWSSKYFIFFINVNRNKTEQDATRLGCVALGWGHRVFCHVCGSQGSRWSSRASRDAECCSACRICVPQEIPAHWVPLPPVTSSHCPTAPLAAPPSPRPAALAPLPPGPRGALGMLAGRREASSAGNSFPGQEATKATSEYEWEPGNASKPIFPPFVTAGTFYPSFP